MNSELFRILVRISIVGPLSVFSPTPSYASAQATAGPDLDPVLPVPPVRESDQKDQGGHASWPSSTIMLGRTRRSLMISSRMQPNAHSSTLGSRSQHPGAAPPPQNTPTTGLHPCARRCLVQCSTLLARANRSGMRASPGDAWRRHTLYADSRSSLSNSLAALGAAVRRSREPLVDARSVEEMAAGQSPHVFACARTA